MTPRLKMSLSNRMGAMFASGLSHLAVLQNLNLPVHFGTTGGRGRTKQTRTGRLYDTVRPAVRKAWSLPVGDTVGRAKALGRDA